MNLSVNIDAVPQGRPRFYRGIAIDPPKCKAFKKEFAELVKKQCDTGILTGAIRLKIDIYRDFKTATNQRYGDADNLAKGIMDALTGVLWQNDKQITDLHITKNLGTPRVNLSIEVI